MENELAVRFVQFDLFQGKKSAFLNEIPLPVKTVARSGDVNKRIPHFRLMNVVDAILRDWRRIIRQSAQHLPSHTDDVIYVMLAKITSKSLYNAFKSKKHNPPTARKKFDEKFTQFPFDWKKVYSLPFTVTIET